MELSIGTEGIGLFAAGDLCQWHAESHPLSLSHYCHQHLLGNFSLLQQGCWSSQSSLLLGRLSLWTHGMDTVLSVGMILFFVSRSRNTDMCLLAKCIASATESGWWHWTHSTVLALIQETNYPTTIQSTMSSSFSGLCLSHHLKELRSLWTKGKGRSLSFASSDNVLWDVKPTGSSMALFTAG